MQIKFSQLIFSIGICLGVGILGSLFTISAIPTWYAALNKPEFSPPNFIFGPVWTILYILMGISFYLIWVKGTQKKAVKNALILFLVHLFFNASWSIVFFGVHLIFLALINIIILWILIIALIIKFSKINKKAAILLSPYLLWVSFATILNYNIWILNK